MMDLIEFFNAMDDDDYVELCERAEQVMDERGTVSLLLGFRDGKPSADLLNDPDEPVTFMIGGAR